MRSKTLLTHIVVACLLAFVGADTASAYYAPQSGRFISRDPIMYPDGANTYSSHFAVSEVDPSGTQVLALPLPIGPMVDLLGCGSSTGNISGSVGQVLPKGIRARIARGIAQQALDAYLPMNWSVSKNCLVPGLQCCPLFTINTSLNLSLWVNKQNLDFELLFVVKTTETLGICVPKSCPCPPPQPPINLMQDITIVGPSSTNSE